MKEFDPPLDPKIAPIVIALVEAGIDTFESCQGGEGHSFPEPTVRFHDSGVGGGKALRVCLENEFPVTQLREVWDVIDGRVQSAVWELVFYLGDEKRNE